MKEVEVIKLSSLIIYKTSLKKHYYQHLIKKKSMNSLMKQNKQQAAY